MSHTKPKKTEGVKLPLPIKTNYIDMSFLESMIITAALDDLVEPEPGIYSNDVVKKKRIHKLK